MDDYQQKVALVLKGQYAPLIDGERHVLARCGSCDRVWLQQGRSARLELSQQEVIEWAASLGAQCQDLPRITCRACAVRYMGGECMYDEYADPGGTIRGYGFSWEAMDPPAHMMAAVCHLSWLASTQPEEKHYTVVTNPALARAVLSWLSTSTQRHDVHYRSFSPEACSMLAMTNPPGAHAPGTQGWVWRGVAWEGECDALRGMVYVSFVWAGPPSGSSAVAAAFEEWRVVAQRAMKYRIAGESSSRQEKEEGA